MTIQLLQGEFSSKDALDLITEMIHVKIKYHENKIAKNGSEEDMKYRESRIKGLQKELFEFRNYLDEKPGTIKLDATIHMER